MIGVNPVLVKELRMRFRNFKGPLILALYLLVIGGFILGFIYLTWHDSAAFNPTRSREIFTALSVTQLILLGFVTPGLTSGVISGERERQTLNVLLTTELSPRTIVISKMISSCAFTLLLIAATLPLYSIVLMFGGIAPGQLLGVFGFYLVTMFLFAAIGIACSTFFKRTGISTVTAYGLTAFLGAGTAFIAVFIYEVIQRSQNFPRTDDVPLIVQLLLDINPMMVLVRILGEDVLSDPAWVVPYWVTYLVFYIGLGVLLLLWSGYLLNPLRKKK